MKKTITLILSVLLLISVLLISCDETNESIDSSDTTQDETTQAEVTTAFEESEIINTVIVVDTYNALAYKQSMGGSSENVDSSTQYTGPDFYNKIYTKKDSVLSKSINLSGKDISVFCLDTLKSNENVYEIDRYSYIAESGNPYAFLYYRTDTGKIVYFDVTPTNDPNYSSPVNEQSTEAEYIEYARTKFLELTGVSTEGWHAKLNISNTYIDSSTYIPACEITFYKMIGDVERCDKMYIKMTTRGEVFVFSAINCEEAFEPFNELDISKDKIEAAVREVYHRWWGRAEITQIDLVTNNGELWADATVTYTSGEYISASSFVVKLAEYPPNKKAAVTTEKPSLDASTTTEWFPDEE